MEWHGQPSSGRPNHLFKLKLAKNVKRAIQKLDWPDWQGHPTEGMQLLAERELQLTVWSQPGRAVVGECAARLLLLTCKLWSIFMRVIKNQQGYTEAITNRYELLMIPGRLVRLVRPKSLRKLRESIKPKTRRNNGKSMDAIAADINRTLKGWFGCFKHVHPSELGRSDDGCGCGRSARPVRRGELRKSMRHSYLYPWRRGLAN